MMLPRAYRLTKSEDFTSVYRKGTKYTGKYTVLYVLALDDPLKIGFVASKKVGKAHERNRVKRQAREAVHQLLLDLPNNHHLVVVMRHKAVGATYFAIYEDLVQLMKKAALL